jgi:hypothetical protein
MRMITEHHNNHMIPLGERVMRAGGGWNWLWVMSIDELRYNISSIKPLCSTTVS